MTEPRPGNGVLTKFGIYIIIMHAIIMYAELRDHYETAKVELISCISGPK